MGFWGRCDPVPRKSGENKKISGGVGSGNSRQRRMSSYNSGGQSGYRNQRLNFSHPLAEDGTTSSPSETYQATNYNYTMCYGLSAGILGAAALSSTAVAALIGAVSGSVGVSAISAAESGALGAVNSTAAGMLSSSASAVIPSSDSYESLGIGSVEFEISIGLTAIISGIGLAILDLLGHRFCSTGSGNRRGHAPFPRFVYFEDTDSGYCSIGSDSCPSLGSESYGERDSLLDESCKKGLFETECSTELSVSGRTSPEGSSVRKWLDGDEGPSGLCCSLISAGSSHCLSFVNVSSSDVSLYVTPSSSAVSLYATPSGSNDGVSGLCVSEYDELCEVVVTEPSGNEEELTEVVVTQPLCGGRSSVREALGSVNGHVSDHNRGPGGKCKQKLKHCTQSR